MGQNSKKVGSVFSANFKVNAKCLPTNELSEMTGLFLAKNCLGILWIEF